MASKEREMVHPDIPRRKALKVAVGALCSEVGFGHAENSAVETLTEMIQSYIQEVGRSAQGYAELSCRTVPMCSDVAVALIDMGTDIAKLSSYAERKNKVYLMPQGISNAPNHPRILQVGNSKDHPSHIPDHLPAFPDPHTYIQTLTNKKPTTEYQLIREKAASQKRDVERALTRFIAKTGDTEKLFEDDPYAFPLIACKPSELPYVDALLPKDEDLEAQELEEKKLNEKKAAQKQLAEEAKEREREKEREKEKEKDSEKNAEKEEPKKEDDENKEKSPSKEEGQGQNEGEGENTIDNPFLRPIKMPRLKGGKSTKSKW